MKTNSLRGRMDPGGRTHCFLPSSMRTRAPPSHPPTPRWRKPQESSFRSFASPTRSRAARAPGRPTGACR